MKHYVPEANPMCAVRRTGLLPGQDFAWSCGAMRATVMLNRPERKNPLTFDATPSCATCSTARQATDVKVVVVTGEGGNFCSGGDVHDIIGPLTKMTMPELLAFRA
jgi:enoyl-CoA hydratase/carnithine racemase